jgi:hypothetical protein
MMNVCGDYQMYWTFVGGAAAAVSVLWPILALMVLGWGKSERYMESKHKFLERKMELALAETVRDINKNKPH